MGMGPRDYRPAGTVPMQGQCDRRDPTAKSVRRLSVCPPTPCMRVQSRHGSVAGRKVGALPNLVGHMDAHASVHRDACPRPRCIRFCRSWVDRYASKHAAISTSNVTSTNATEKRVVAALVMSRSWTICFMCTWQLGACAEISDVALVYPTVDTDTSVKKTKKEYDDLCHYL